MKKLFVLLLAAILCLLLVACNGGAVKTETIEITAENWQQYFEVKLAATVHKNDFDEVEMCFANHYVYVKQEYRDRLVEADVAFGWSCDGYGLAVYTHDLDTGALTYGDVAEQDAPLGTNTEGTFSYKYNADRQKYFAKINTDSMGTVTDSTVVNRNTVTWKGYFWEQVVITRVQGSITITE